jgi:hypothetical protein
MVARLPEGVPTEFRKKVSEILRKPTQSCAEYILLLVIQSQQFFLEELHNKHLSYGGT